MEIKLTVHHSEPNPKQDISGSAENRKEALLLIDKFFKEYESFIIEKNNLYKLDGSIKIDVKFHENLHFNRVTGTIAPEKIKKINCGYNISDNLNF